MRPTNVNQCAGASEGQLYELHTMNCSLSELLSLSDHMSTLRTPCERLTNALRTPCFVCEENIKQIQ